MDFGVQGAGLLGPAGTGSGMALASAAGSALAGGYVGMQVGGAVSDWLEKPGQSSDFQTGAAGGVGGAASGAAAGFAVGGPVGAVIGAVVGGLAGLFKGTGAENRREDAQKAQEQAQTDAQRPGVLQLGQQAAAGGLQLQPAIQQLSDPSIRAALVQKATTDPEIGALLQQAHAAFTQTGLIERVFGTDKAFTPDEAGLFAFLSAVNGAAGLAKEYGTASTDNPESGMGLLLSGETGQFGPGVKLLQNRAQDVQTSQALITQLLQRLGG